MSHSYLPLAHLIANLGEDAPPVLCGPQGILDTPHSPICARLGPDISTYHNIIIYLNTQKVTHLTLHRRPWARAAVQQRACWKPGSSWEPSGQAAQISMHRWPRSSTACSPLSLSLASKEQLLASNRFRHLSLFYICGSF